MESKSTLKFYREGKQKIEEIKWFRNGFRFSIMMQVRSNTLPLGWRAFRDEECKLCRLCSQGEVETLEHFLLGCTSLQQTRNKHLFLQMPRKEDENSIIKEMLLLKVNEEISNNTAINSISELWNARSKIIENL